MGDGWEESKDQIQLQGWTRARRVIVLRRSIKHAVLEDKRGENDQAWLSGVEPRKGHVMYEYSMLVTSLRSRDYLMLSQLYRDRAETDNVFDELKNQWGWTGYTTQDLHRSQLMARIVALIFNWWNLYSRLALPNKHAEAITTRPMFSHGVARRTSHSGQSHLTITSTHGHASKVMRTLAQISNLLKNFRQNAEQFAQELRWPMLLRLIFKKFYETIPAPKRLPVPS